MEAPHSSQSAIQWKGFLGGIIEDRRTSPNIVEHLSLGYVSFAILPNVKVIFYIDLYLILGEAHIHYCSGYIPELVLQFQLSLPGSYAPDVQERIKY